MAKSTKKYYRYIIILLGTCITFGLIFTYLKQPALIKQVDYKIYDYFLSDLADGKPHQSPVILDIDEQSLSEFGQWPWPRYRLALIINKLFDAGALSVALDIVLAEADRTSPAQMQEDFKKELGLDVDFQGLPAALYDNDSLLWQNIAGKPVVLGAYMRFDSTEILSETTKEQLKTLSPKIVEFSKPNGVPALTYLAKAYGITLPISTLLEKTNIGFFNISSDEDGVARKAPLLFQLNGKIYGNLAIQAMLQATKQKTLRLNTNAYGLESLSIGAYTLPVNPDGSANIIYRGESKTFPYISASDILNDKYDPLLLENAIVFIGTSAAGLLDIRATPFDNYYPGVEVHATLVDGFLSGRSVITPAWTPGLQFVLLILTGIIGTFFFFKIKAAYSALLIVGLTSTLFFISKYFFSQGYYISPLWVILHLLLLAISIISLRFWWEEKNKKILRNVFSRYVSPEVVSRIVEQGGELLKGEERELSIMFTDLRGFTSLSETLLPENVVTILNTYFTPMTALVRNAEGTLDKFIGDAIMAFWNAPLFVEHHREKAVDTAINMLNTLEEINKELKEKFDITLNMGIGIHTGLAFVGNMGSLDLTSYTAIGDTVNTASRLEGLCSKYGFRIIVSEEAIKNSTYSAIPISNLRVKGRKETIQIYTIFTHLEEELYKEEIQEYRIAYAVYKTVMIEKTEVILNECIQLFKSLSQKYSRPLYKEYYSYCQNLLTENKENWDGIWTLTSK